MYPQKTYSLTEAVNKIGNWYSKLSFAQQAVVLVGAVVVLREIAPKRNYYYSDPKPLPAPRKDFPETTKKLTKIKQGFVCNSCKKPPKFWEFHHIDGNRSNNKPSNCEGLCLDCHADKHRKMKI